MMQQQQFKHILCIRADNMGDVIMTTPCFRALKDTYHCRITLLTSQMGSKITPYIAEIDETIVADLPWVKTPQCLQEHDLLKLIRTLRNYHFSAAIIFSVYSQNTLPAAMLAYMAGIPVRLAYCRENPYELLTHWKVDNEPYEYILHQVERDLDLVRFIGASTKNETLHLTFSPKAREKALKKLSASGINTQGRWLILHVGVSEEKRCYPMDRWIKTGRLLRDQLKCQLVITGSSSEKKLAGKISAGIGEKAYCLAGDLSLEEFIALISAAPLVISVNTATIHIAAATNTPVIVLYALTNPQHTPWKTASSVLYYSVPEELKSRNAVVNYVSEKVMDKEVPFPEPEKVLEEVKKRMKEWSLVNAVG